MQSINLEEEEEQNQKSTNIEHNKNLGYFIINSVIILSLIILFSVIDTLESKIDFDLVEVRIVKTDSLLLLFDITLFAITGIAFGINVVIQFYKSIKIQKNSGIDNLEKKQIEHKIKSKKSFNIFFGIIYSLTLIAFLTHIIYLMILLFSM